MSKHLGSIISGIAMVACLFIWNSVLEARDTAKELAIKVHICQMDCVDFEARLRDLERARLSQ